MYRSALLPLLECQRQNAAQKAVMSNARRQQAAEMAIDGRVRAFATLSTPEQIAEQFGPQTGKDAMQLQSDSLASRASILLGISDLVSDAVAQDPTSNPAPRVVSLNAVPSQLSGCEWVAPEPLLVGPDPVVSMPLRAPVVYDTPIGPASFPAPGMPPGGNAGMSGYSPTWADAWMKAESESQPSTGVMSWFSDHPWLALALAAGGLAVASRRSR